MGKDRQFWNKAAERYFASPIADQESYAEKLRLTQKYLRPDMRMLEFGCGTGGTAAAHAPYVKEILATDFSENMLSFGRERVEKAGLSNIEFKVADITSYQSEKDHKFDVILCLNLLHLLRSPRQAIENVHSNLKPGGLFVSSTVCPAAGWKLLWPLVILGQAIGKVPFFKFIAKRELDGYIQESGFEILEKHLYFNGRSQFIIARKKP